MPPAMRYDNLTDHQKAALESAFSDELKVRVANYQRARKYYDGDHHKHLKRDNTDTDDNVIINLTRLIVDKSVATLLGITQADEITTVSFDVIDEETEKGARSVLAKAAELFRRNQEAGQVDEANPAQAYLDSTLEANMAPLLWAEIATLGSLSGHNFMKVLPNATVNDMGQPVPRLVALHPTNCTIFWAQDDRNKVLWYRVQYANTREDIVRNEATEAGGDGWTIYRYSRARDYDRFTLEETERWPFPWAPMIDWQHNPNPGEVYGRADADKDIIDLNDQLNFTLSNTQRILKHHAHPKTIGTGVGKGELNESAINSLWTIESPEAQIVNLEMQSDLSSSLNMASLLRQAMFDQARELDPATVQDKLGQLTNFGLRVLNNDRLTKAGVQRAMMSQGLRRIVRAIFNAGGFDMYIPFNVEWPDIITDDPVQKAMALEVDTRHGLSQYTYLEKQGYDPDLEEVRRQEDIREALAQDTTLVQRQAAARLTGG